jgi:hypothetical protein
MEGGSLLLEEKSDHKRVAPALSAVVGPAFETLTRYLHLWKASRTLCAIGGMVIQLRYSDVDLSDGYYYALSGLRIF